MSFTWPALLLLLLALPPAAGLYIALLRRRRRRVAAGFGALGGAAAAAARTGRLRKAAPPLLFLLALAVLIVSLARPQAVVSLPRFEGSVMLVFDSSGSMAAEDVEPTRMEAAKAAARAFVEQQPAGVLLGVVAFSDNGFATQAPTVDRDAVLEAIDRLKPQRGTSLAHGVVAAIDTLAAEPETRFYTNLTPTPSPTPTPVPAGAYAPAAIVLFTDGENTVSPDPMEAAQIAADRGVRIYTVGIGSPAGAVLNIDGFLVHTRLDEALLRQMSELTGGAYSNAGSAEDLRAVVANLTPQWVVKADETELTSLFAGAGILIMLVGGAFSLLWFGRLP